MKLFPQLDLCAEGAFVVQFFLLLQLPADLSSVTTVSTFKNRLHLTTLWFRLEGDVRFVSLYKLVPLGVAVETNSSESIVSRG